jgi:hypothetical protein
MVAHTCHASYMEGIDRRIEVWAGLVAQAGDMRTYLQNN